MEDEERYEAHIYDLSDDEYSVIFSYLDTQKDIMGSILYVSRDFQCIALRTLQTVRLDSNAPIETNIKILETLNDLMMESGGVMRIKQLNLMYCSAELLSHLAPLFQPVLDDQEDRIMIKQLVLTFCKMTDEQFKESILPLSCVEHLNLRQVSSLKPISIVELATSEMGKRLKILDLNGCLHALNTKTLPVLDTLCTNLTQLERICLKSCMHLQPQDFAAIKNLVNLRILDLSDTKVNDDSMAEILPVLCNYYPKQGEQMGKLEELRLANAPALTSATWDLIAALHVPPQDYRVSESGLRLLSVNADAIYTHFFSFRQMVMAIPTIKSLYVDRIIDQVMEDVIAMLNEKPLLQSFTVEWARPHNLLSDESLLSMSSLLHVQHLCLHLADKDIIQELKKSIKRVSNESVR